MEKELTRAEEQIMDYLWDLEEAYVKDIIAKMDPPKPAYTTISTIIRILEKKGFVGHRTFGNTHLYFPLISKEDYSGYCTKNLVSRYFSNSLGQFVSAFASSNDLSIGELEEIQRLINEEIEQKKNRS